MVLVDFLMKYPKNKFDILYFDHGTECCQEAKDFIVDFCDKNGIDLTVGKITRSRFPGESQEEYWRKERYAFLAKYSSEPILMAHHLNDVIETWTMSCMNGNPQLIPYHNAKYNIFRPFLCVSKHELAEWSTRHDVKCVFDRSNNDTSLKRNYVRHNMIDDIYHISPGIEKIMAKKIMKSFNESHCEKILV